MHSRRNFITNVAGLAGAIGASPNLPAANDRIRAGLIGPGTRGNQLLDQVLKVPNVECVAFADVFTKRLEAAKARVPGAKTYLDYRYLLDDKSIDAVFIATPQHLHCEHFVASLQAGKHVYQEKTMAFTVDHAKRMRAARREASKLTVQIGHQDCSSGQVRDCRNFLDKGYLGKITEIHAHMYRNTPHSRPQWTRPITPEMVPENIIWKSFLGEAPQRDFDPNRYINWRFYWDYSGGNFYENMCHQLAFWYKVLDMKIPSEVASLGGVFLWKDGREVPDTMIAAMSHKTEDMLFNWDSAFGNNQLGITEDVLGTDGTISRGEEILYRPQKVNRRDLSDMHGETVDKGQNNLDLRHVGNFFECIRSGKEPACPFEIGFRVAIACRMAVDALRQGRILHWDPAREEIV